MYQIHNRKAVTYSFGDSLQTKVKKLVIAVSVGIVFYQQNVVAGMLAVAVDPQQIARLEI